MWGHISEFTAYKSTKRIPGISNEIYLILTLNCTRYEIPIPRLIVGEVGQAG